MTKTWSKNEFTQIFQLNVQCMFNVHGMENERTIDMQKLFQLNFAGTKAEYCFNKQKICILLNRFQIEEHRLHLN